MRSCFLVHQSMKTWANVFQIICDAYFWRRVFLNLREKSAFVGASPREKPVRERLRLFIHHTRIPRLEPRRCLIDLLHGLRESEEYLTKAVAQGIRHVKGRGNAFPCELKALQASAGGLASFSWWPCKLQLHAI